ncbi:MAG TPA: adenosylcobinamide-GDP ribazoletransferase [Stellaceae bacterium]|nr:adenosylcobinamide-GDP ribazoletransferase [Stellaceae bacterium]
MQLTPPRWSDLAGRWDELRFAAGFLTCLPVAAPAASPAGALAEASWAFPVIGTAIGLIGAAAYALAAALGLPPLASALLTLAATAAATGALHEDGLADSADGLLGGGNRVTRLAIMRDSRSGPYGVLALIVGVGLRAAALAALGDPVRVAAALVAAHAAARGGLPLVLRALDPARDDGLGALAGRPEPATAWTAAAIGAAIALVALRLGAGLSALIVAGGAMALTAGLARRRIGGYTGDVLGAVEQAGETVMLLAASTWVS